MNAVELKLDILRKLDSLDWACLLSQEQVIYKPSKGSCIVILRFEDGEEDGLLFASIKTQ